MNQYTSHNNKKKWCFNPQTDGFSIITVILQSWCCHTSPVSYLFSQVPWSGLSVRGAAPHQHCLHRSCPHHHPLHPGRHARWATSYGDPGHRGNHSRHRTRNQVASACHQPGWTSQLGVASVVFIVLVYSVVISFHCLLFNFDDNFVLLFFFYCRAVVAAGNDKCSFIILFYFVLLETFSSYLLILSCFMMFIFVTYFILNIFLVFLFYFIVWLTLQFLWGIHMEINLASPWSNQSHNPILKSLPVIER